MGKEFPELHDLPKVILADGTPVILGEPSKFKKSGRGKRYNGKHKD